MPCWQANPCKATGKLDLVLQHILPIRSKPSAAPCLASFFRADSLLSKEVARHVASESENGKAAPHTACPVC